MKIDPPDPRDDDEELIPPRAGGEGEHADADERVDEAIDESFPASDPPSWNAGVDRET